MSLIIDILADKPAHLSAASKYTRADGRAIIVLVRKFLGIINRALKHKWVFENLPNFFVLAEGA